MTSEGRGFTGGFQTRMAWLFHESTRHLLSSDGWRNFEESADITHLEIEERVNMDELAKVFEEWLDEQLNRIDKDAPVKQRVGLEFHWPQDCPLKVHVPEESDEEEDAFHHGECAMVKCVCTHYGDDRDHWAPCVYQGKRIPRDELVSHSTIMEDEA